MARLANFKRAKVEHPEDAVAGIIDTELAIGKISAYCSNKLDKHGEVYCMRPETIANRQKYLRHIVKEHGLQWTPEWVEHVRSSIASKTLKLGEPSRDGWIKPSTARIMLYAIEDLFAANGIRFDGKPVKIGKPHTLFNDHRRMTDATLFHTKEEIDRLIGAASVDMRDHCMLMFAWYTGARPTEVLQCDHRQLELDKKYVKMYRYKTSTYDEVPLPSDMVAEFRDYFRFREENGIGFDRYPLVFLNTQHGERPLTIHAYEHIINQYAAKVGLDSNPYKFRHSRASYLLNVKHLEPAKVAALTGHSVLTLTNWYTHVTKEQIRASLNAIGEI